ncbi:hypothetical protein WJX72_003849 [[Myrmecia] bisecta]|uniref:Uncharacterized protein n=1 Tax=[Myrmecia] bisecta TaxID=41462 RepID=A0AAW1PAB7_9CHLO
MLWLESPGDRPAARQRVHGPVAGGQDGWSPFLDLDHEEPDQQAKADEQGEVDPSDQPLNSHRAGTDDNVIQTYYDPSKNPTHSRKVTEGWQPVMGVVVLIALPLLATLANANYTAEIGDYSTTVPVTGSALSQLQGTWQGTVTSQALYYLKGLDQPGAGNLAATNLADFRCAAPSTATVRITFGSLQNDGLDALNTCLESTSWDPSAALPVAPNTGRGSATRSLPAYTMRLFSKDYPAQGADSARVIDYYGDTVYLSLLTDQPALYPAWCYTWKMNTQQKTAQFAETVQFYNTIDYTGSVLPNGTISYAGRAAPSYLMLPTCGLNPFNIDPNAPSVIPSSNVPQCTSVLGVDTNNQLSGGQAAVPRNNQACPTFNSGPRLGFNCNATKGSRRLLQTTPQATPAQPATNTPDIQQCQQIGLDSLPAGVAVCLCPPNTACPPNLNCTISVLSYVQSISPVPAGFFVFNTLNLRRLVCLTCMYGPPGTDITLPKSNIGICDHMVVGLALLANDSANGVVSRNPAILIQDCAKGTAVPQKWACPAVLRVANLAQGGPGSYSDADRDSCMSQGRYANAAYSQYPNNAPLAISQTDTTVAAATSTGTFTCVAGACLSMSEG